VLRASACRLGPGLAITSIVRLSECKEKVLAVPSWYHFFDGSSRRSWPARNASFKRSARAGLRRAPGAVGFISKDSAIVYPKFALVGAGSGDTINTVPLLFGFPVRAAPLGTRWSPAKSKCRVISALREVSVRIKAACDDRCADRVYAIL
jgi:hypothetical protein